MPRLFERLTSSYYSLTSLQVVSPPPLSHTTPAPTAPVNPPPPSDLNPLSSRPPNLLLPPPTPLSSSNDSIPKPRLATTEANRSPVVREQR